MSARRPLVRRSPGSMLLAALLALGVVTASPVGTTAQAQDDPQPAPVSEEEPAPAEAGATDDARDAAEAQRLVGEAAVAWEAAQPHLAEAFAALEKRDWPACLEPFGAAAGLLEPHELLAGLRDQCLYNTACALARLDRPDEAVAAFRRSVEHGLRDIANVAGGRVQIQRGLTLPHVLADPDLDALRQRADFAEVLDGLLRAGAPVLEASAAAAGHSAPLPAVIALLRSDGLAEAEASAWREALDGVPCVIAFVEGPVRPRPALRRWLLGDGDVRFGAERIDAAIDAVRGDSRVDRARVVVTAAGPAAAEAAWASVLERPADVAGLVFGPSRFHAAWHADALARLADARAGLPFLAVHLIGTTARAADLLAEAGAEVHEIEAPEPSVPSETPEDVSPRDRFAVLRAAVAEAAAALLR